MSVCACVCMFQCVYSLFPFSLRETIHLSKDTVQSITELGQCPNDDYKQAPHTIVVWSEESWQVGMGKWNHCPIWFIWERKKKKKRMDFNPLETMAASSQESSLSNHLNCQGELRRFTCSSQWKKMPIQRQIIQIKRDRDRSTPSQLVQSWDWIAKCGWIDIRERSYQMK